MISRRHITLLANVSSRMASAKQRLCPARNLILLTATFPTILKSTVNRPRVETVVDTIAIAKRQTVEGATCPSPRPKAELALVPPTARPKLVNAWMMGKYANILMLQKRPVRILSIEIVIVKDISVSVKWLKTEGVRLKRKHPMAWPVSVSWMEISVRLRGRLSSAEIP